MKKFITGWIGIGLMYSACLIIAFPVTWIIKLEQPSLDDILNMMVLRIFICLWVFSLFGSWWLNRD